MLPPSDPLPNDDQPAVARAPIHPPEVESLRTIYDRRRRRIRLALTLGALIFAAVLGVAVWLFIRFPLRAMQEHGRVAAVREYTREIDQQVRAGDDQAAADSLRKRLALIDRTREPALWARTARYLAGQYFVAQRYDDERAILDDAVPWAEKHPALGPDSVETLGLIGALADLEGAQGHDEAAEALFQRVLATSERVFGANDESTLMALNDYGWFLLERSRLNEAEPLLLRCIGGMEKSGLANTSSMANVLDSVAHLRDKQNRLTEAIDLQRRAVKIAREKYSKQATQFKKLAGYLAELEARAKAGPAEK